MKTDKQYTEKKKSSDGDGDWLVASAKKKNSSQWGTGVSKRGKKPSCSNDQGGMGNNRFYLPKQLETKLHKPPNPHTVDLKQRAALGGPKARQLQKEKPSFLSIMGSKPGDADEKPSFLSIMGSKPDDADGRQGESELGLATARISRRPKRPKLRSAYHSSQKAADNAISANSSGPYSPSPSMIHGGGGDSSDDGYITVRPKKKQGTRRPTAIDGNDILLRRVADTENILLDLPSDVLSRVVLRFLEPKDLLSFGSCSTRSQKIASEGFLWKSCMENDFPDNKTLPVSETEWRLAYQVVASKLDLYMRCSHTKQTFLEDVIGLGVDYTVNPRTRKVDYISVSQDLISRTAFDKHGVRTDVFGNSFKLFLPLYFSEEHFHRALPFLKETIARLWKRVPSEHADDSNCLDVLPFGREPPKKKEKASPEFKPNMILDIFPKIVTTFVVLLSDEGTAACQKSFDGFTRIHRTFLALAQAYPSIRQEAVRRLTRFASREENRSKRVCPNLGSILPLLLIVDDREFTWAKIRSAYLSETFDRSVLWVCKKYPHLDKISYESTEKGHERVALTCDAMAVPLRLTMFYVYFLNAACRGSVSHRCHKYDTAFFGPPWNEKESNQPDPQQKPVGTEAQEIPGNNATPGATQPDSATVKMSDADAVDGEGNPTALSFEYFRDQVNNIHTIATWQKFFQFVGVACPAKTKEGMAELLRSHVQNSHRRKYHQEGMDYSKIQARGTSKILAKGQQYNTSRDLKRLSSRIIGISVVVSNTWTRPAFSIEAQTLSILLIGAGGVLVKVASGTLAT